MTPEIILNEKSWLLVLQIQNAILYYGIPKCVDLHFSITTGVANTPT